MSDIAVTMGPQGVSEVVAALHKIQQESGRTARAGADAAGGVAKISGAISSLKSAAASLGGLYLANQFKNIVVNAIDAADAIGDLSTATGVSVKDISVLAYTAKQTGTDFGVIEKAMKSFMGYLSDLKSGDTKKIDEFNKAFAGTGLTAQQLTKMDASTALKRLAGAFGQMSDEEDKLTKSSLLFGKAGLDMVDVLGQLNQEGFETLTEKTKSAGMMMDDETTRAAGDCKAKMADLESAALGLANEFARGLIPGLVGVADGLSTATTKAGETTSAIRELGGVASTVLGAFSAGAGTVWTGLTTGAKEIWATTKTVATAGWNGVFMMDWGAAVDSWNKGSQEIVDIATEGRDKIQQIVSPIKKALGWGPDETVQQKVNSGIGRVIPKNYKEYLKQMGLDPKLADPVVPATPKPGSASFKNTAKALAEAQSAYLKARIDAENRIIEANNARQLQFLKDQYDFDMSETAKTYDEKMAIVKNYYADVRKIAQENGENELLALQVQIDELQAKKTDNPADELKRQAELLKLNAEFQAKSLELEQQQSAAYKEELKALRDINKERAEQYKQVGEAQFDLAQRTAELQGRTIEAQEMALDKELAGKWESLRLSENIGSVEWQSAKATYDDYERARRAEIDFQRQKMNLTQEMDRLDQSKRAIQADMAAGRISEWQGEERILQLEKARLPVLDKLVALLMAAAAATGNKALMAEAAQYAAQAESIRASLEIASASFQVFNSKAMDAIRDSITSFFTSGINNAKSFGDAMRSMALGVIQALQQIVAQMLINLMFQKLMGGIFAAIGGGGSGTFGMFSGGGANMVRMATGGFVSGPGTGTSDSIPAMLSNGEFVVPARAVAQPGVLPALEQLRAGMNLSVVQPSFRRHRFAEGGLVTPGGGSGGGDHSSLTVALEEGLVLRALETPKGKRVLVKALADKRRTVRGVLG